MLIATRTLITAGVVACCLTGCSATTSTTGDATSAASVTTSSATPEVTRDLDACELFPASAADALLPGAQQVSDDSQTCIYASPDNPQFNVSLSIKDDDQDTFDSAQGAHSTKTPAPGLGARGVLTTDSVDVAVNVRAIWMQAGHILLLNLIHAPTPDLDALTGQVRQAAETVHRAAQG